VTRTVWVTNDFPPRAGGIEQFVGNLVGRLDPASVRVLTSRWPGSEAHDARLAYRVDRVGRRPLLPTRSLLRRVTAAVSDVDADVVVFGASWPLGELARRLSVPTFALSHGHEAGMARAGLGPLLRRTARGLDVVGVISRFSRAALEPWMAPHVRLVDLPPGVDTGEFRPEVDGIWIRERYDVPVDVPLVVCIGRLVPRKGQDVLVEAWPEVRRRVRGAHLLLCGGGRYERALRRRVSALGLDRAIAFTGTVGWPELAAHHVAGDLFAMPCRTRLRGLDVEGLGIVYLEAQACGRPVIAGRSGGAPEALVPDETGLVVDGRSASAVATGIIDLLTHEERRNAMGKAGRLFVEQHHAWSVIADRLRGALGELVAR
jgi:phosphatidyl-myo-inositol dimannoside synthase